MTEKEGTLVILPCVARPSMLSQQKLEISDKWQPRPWERSHVWVSRWGRFHTISPSPPSQSPCGILETLGLDFFHSLDFANFSKPLCRVAMSAMRTVTRSTPVTTFGEEPCECQGAKTGNGAAVKMKGMSPLRSSLQSLALRTVQIPRAQHHSIWEALLCQPQKGRPPPRTSRITGFPSATETVQAGCRLRRRPSLCPQVLTSHGHLVIHTAIILRGIS